LLFILFSIMATLILGSIGSVFASSIGTAGMLTPALASIAKLGGNFLGTTVDNHVFNGGKKIISHGPSLVDPKVQCDIYGNIIPIVYGTCKSGGSVIWASKVRESIQQQSQTSRHKMRSVTHVHNNYSYSVSMAIAICEGPISSVRKIWADDILITEKGNVNLSQGSPRTVAEIEKMAAQKSVF
jgi:hypothetical protein